MARSVFYGVGAFIGSITGPTTCAFWPDDPNRLGWKTGLLVSVDLANTPEAVRQGKIAQADVDDFAGYGTGGLTRVGPIFPAGATMGTLYLEESKCGALGPNDPTKGARPWEWATVVYYDGPMAGRRFHGFHGHVVKNDPTGTLALVSLWARGTSAVPGVTPMGTYWFDIATQLHPPDPTLPIVPVAAGNAGGVFVDSKSGVMPFDTPKSPRWAGGIRAPEGRRVR